MCVQYCGGCSVPLGGRVFSTVGDIMSTVGGYFEYRGGYSGTVGGYHEYRGGVQYRGGTQITERLYPPWYLTAPGTHDITTCIMIFPCGTEYPPRYSTYLPTVLMIFLHSTHDIPYGTQDIPPLLYRVILPRYS